MHAIAIHGGAGAMPREEVSSARVAEYHASLARALDGGFAILDRGGASLDAVTTAVRMLEDDPLFNAGRGAALTRDGWVELDAAVMSGARQKAGAVAAVRHVKNPVDLARRVMEKSRHVLLVGDGAEEFALEENFPLVPNLQLRTDERRRQLACEQQGTSVSDLIPDVSQGTVGAVALDARGDLAAATSTGGMTNKRQGRVGDSPIIGAGTYAKNGVCAVSATGHGEYFIRAVAAYHICCAVEYRSLSLADAAHETIHKNIRALGGTGGVIAIDAHGNIVMEFSTAGMFRGARDARGRHEIAIYRGDSDGLRSYPPQRR
jgi:beta-aspartyl-peptidase (threonine type)